MRRERGHLGLVALLALLSISACGRSEFPEAESAATVVDGRARFQVLTPTLLRLEYAEDGGFEDRPTQTVPSRALPPPAFTASVENGERVIRTSALTLRYRQGSGPFTPDNLRIELARGDAVVEARPDWSPGPKPGNLGGWRRGLDNEQDPQPLHDGVLSREGWYLLDDSRTVLMVGQAPGFATRPERTGAYQDGYFFGYGRDYARGLADLRALTGAVPLLPRKALGVWFSRYWAYSEAELRELVARFRAQAIPLDVLSMDTDWKRVHNAIGCVAFGLIAGARLGDPCSWNGWEWNRDQFPDPAAFLRWAKSEGLEIGLNIHPSISSRDPRFGEVAALDLATDDAQPSCFLFQVDPLARCHVFDWTDARQLQGYLDLHTPLAEGVDFWWLDWCCDGSKAVAPGLTADAWINAHYHAMTERQGSRWPAFSRIGASFQEGKGGAGNGTAGAVAEHRSTLHFTGDTCATWPMLAFQAEMTAAEGNIGMAYVSHDIGSFLGEPVAGTVCNGIVGRTPHLTDDLYVRWLQFGTFQPLDRLHSHHGERLPWEYPGKPEQVVGEFLRLRGRLVPYLYQLSREAHDTGLPMARPLYLQWPELDEAYAHRSQYTLGRDMLIATVAAPGDPVSMSVWIPPGRWSDYFTGTAYEGPATVTIEVPWERYPVFLRAGAIIPTQPDLPTTPAGAPTQLQLDFWAGADGELDLYDDEGQGFGYRQGAHARTPIRSTTAADGCFRASVAPMRGSFPGAPTARRWTLRVHGIDAPAVVRLDGETSTAWSYDAARRVLSIDAGLHATTAPLTLSAGPQACGA